MKARLIIPLIFAASLFVGVAEAVLTPVYGLGAKTCGTWIEKRRTGDYFDMAQWMLGYISAAGFFGPDLRDSEAEAFMTYMDNYCQQNPLQQFSTGVRRLISELKVVR